MNNRLLAILLTLTILLTYMPAIAFADDGDTGAAKAYAKDGITYSISGGIAMVTGYTKSPVDLVIPEKVDGATVTKIDEKAFRDCKTLKSVVFPSSITDIGNLFSEDAGQGFDGSFARCTNLSRVKFAEPSNLKMIGMGSFLECTSLKEISIPDGTETIAQCSLDGTSLTKLDIPASVLEFNTENYMPSLQEINVKGNSVIYKSVDGILYVDHPTDGLVLICFPAAKRLDKYIAPEWLDYLEGAYFNGEVDQVVISGKTQVSNGGLIKCNSFAATEGSEYCSTEDGLLYSKNYDKLLAIPQKRTGTVEIRDTVREISACAGMLGQFTSVVIPDRVKELPAQCFYESRLKTVTLPDSIEVIGDQVFQNCDQLRIKKLPKSLKYIGFNAFWGVNIRGVKLYEGFEVLGYQAFASSIGLDKLILPSTVHGVETMGFIDLSCVVFTGDMPEMEEDLTWWTTYCYYPAENTTWDADKLKNRAAALDGREIWLPYTGDPEKIDPFNPDANAVIDPPDEPTQIKRTLPSVKISKAVAGKKSATVKWKKVSKKNQKKIAKIQIQYSTDKSFKTGVSTVYAKKTAASKKISKLKKGKKYYFRIRAYKKSGSKICVSKWSKVKSAKVK